MPGNPSSAAAPLFDAGMLRRYDRPGPRYTSYPTALQFTPAFGGPDYLDAARRSNEAGADLSLYVHVPFCASPCYYCACTRIITRQPALAAAYLTRLVQEIRLQGPLFDRKRVVRQLHLGGGTPTYFSIAQLGELMTALDHGFTLADDEAREYSIEMDPRTAHPGVIEGLAGLGFNRLSLGVQDFDPRVQQAVNRVQTVKDTADLIGQARAVGFRSISLDLIYGLPLQTPLSFARTLDLVAALRPHRVAAYSYAHLPSRFKAQRQIRLEDLPSPETKLDLLRLCVEKLTAAGYVYIGMDHFALPDDELAVAQARGGLHRNFQGYSTRGGLDLVGIGLSSIGKVADTYSQNAKRLNDYYAALDAGTLPVERGVRLSADDRLRRDVIEALMCHGRIDTRAVAAAHGIDFDAHFAAALHALRPMVQDGLVELAADSIAVTARGRLLLRAVAMAFDAYLAPQAEAPRHSRII